jgi:hypothetical protein
MKARRWQLGDLRLSSRELSKKAEGEALLMTEDQ